MPADPVAGHPAEGPTKRRRIHEKVEEDPTEVEGIDSWGPSTTCYSSDPDGSEELAATILRKSKIEAVEYAHMSMALSGMKAEEGVVTWNFFVDGSMGPTDPSNRGSPGAYSLVYRNPEDGEWVEQAWFIESMFNNNWGELMAIAEALNVATLRLRLEPTVTTAVIHIFTDSKVSLGYLERKTGSTRVLFDLVMGPLWWYIKALSRELHQRGAWLVLSHIPGHKHDVVGHARADKAAHKKYLEGKKTLDDMRNGRR
jgi:hypothetical protein